MNETNLDRRNVAVCVLLLILSVSIIYPKMELSFTDDWSYVFTARHLALTGHFQYNGWATASLGAQAGWAAIWIRFFGFSFTLVRLSTLPFACGCALLLYALLRRSGLQPKYSTLGTLMMVLNPIFLPLVCSFMTDVYGFFFFLLSLYGCVRIAQTQEPKIESLWGWITLTVAAVVIGTTVRQINALVLLVGFPYITFRLKDQQTKFVAFVAWLFGLLLIVMSIRWYQSQAYSIAESPFEGVRPFLEKFPRSLISPAGLVLKLELMVLPVTLLMIPIWRKRISFSLVTLCLILVGAGIGPLILFRHFPLAPWVGNMVNECGVLFTETDQQPPVLPSLLRYLLTAITLSMTALIALTGLRYFRARTQGKENLASEEQPVLLSLLILIIPLYFLLIILRSATSYGIYDRYMLYMMPLPILGMLLAYQRSNIRKWEMTVWSAFAVYALFGIAITHDYFEVGRAIDRARRQLVGGGIPNKQMEVYGYDGWTQLELTGHVNDPRVRVPAHSYQPGKGTFPDLHPRYVIGLSAHPELIPTDFPPEYFRKWLPFFEGKVTILRVPTASDTHYSEHRSK